MEGRAGAPRVPPTLAVGSPSLVGNPDPPGPG